MEESKSVTDFSVIKRPLKKIVINSDVHDYICRKVIVVNQIARDGYFLFNMFVYHLLQTKKLLHFDDITIMRCMKFVMNDFSCRNNLNKLKNLEDPPLLKEHVSKWSKIIVNNDNKIYDALNVFVESYCLRNYFDKYVERFPNREYHKHDKSAAKYSLAFMAAQLMTNIKVHVSHRFLSFQRKYLRCVIQNAINGINIKSPIIRAIVNCVQHHINTKYKTFTVLSKKLCNSEHFKKLIPIMKNVIEQEKHHIPDDILENTTNSHLQRNHIAVIQYYYHMIGYLEGMGKKCFSLLPQLDAGIRSVNFSARSLSFIFNDLIKHVSSKSEDEQKQFAETYDITLRKVPIKEFERDQQKYYKILFNTKPVESQTRNGFLITSINTDGYSVSVLLAKNKLVPKKAKKTEKSKKPSNIKLDEAFKINNVIDPNKKYKRGLFDADNTKTSSNFLNKFHKIGIDPNNETMCYCVSETGHVLKISKKFYLSESHIHRNQKKRKKLMDTSSINEYYQELSLCKYKRTVNPDEYAKAIEITRCHWDEIWKFYGSMKYLKLDYDTFVHKQKAIHKIARKIVPKKHKAPKFQGHKNKHIIKNSEEVMKKPIMIAFGKGNGNTTISNIRGSGPKGPIKAVAKELSKLCPVILTDEYNTSKICSGCEIQTVTHPVCKQKCRTLIKTGEKLPNGKEKRKRVEVVKEVQSHRLCSCNHESHQASPGSHKLWNRDYNAARNILSVMQKKLLSIPLGEFKRNPKKESNRFCWSQDDQQAAE